MIGQLLGLGLVTATALAVVATIMLFTIGDGARPRTPGRTLLLATISAGAASAVAPMAGVGWPHAAVVGGVLASGVVAWYRGSSGWATRGLAAWSLWAVAGAFYLLYVAWWIATADLSAVATTASLVLLLLEVFVYVLALGYVWELVDVVARRTWPRTADLDAVDASYRPFVSLHVPAHNEPPEMVIRTLEALLCLDYEDYEIIMIDDNTEDEALWRPVEEFCASNPLVTFVHLEDWPGYKSGALNYALTITDPRAEVIGVVDADYIVQPNWLARVVPLFAEEKLSFVQTPQDYRDWDTAPYFRRLYHSYAYFFDVSQRSRNEAGGPIFGGTMGLIRKKALQQVGGWDEWCITEDAELSLRLLKAGWTGQHVHESFGHGLMPLTFEALKRQRFRWCFGGIQILRMHGRSLLPWNRSADNNLDQRQRWAYLVGGLQWFGDVAALAFLGFLLVGAFDLITGDGLVVRRLSGLLLVALVSLVLLSALRALAGLRRMRAATWSTSMGAFGLWLALGWAVAQGAVRGALAREGEFLRTPKQRGHLTWRDALRGNKVETALAGVCLAAAVASAATGSLTGVAIAGLLLVQATGFAAAPVNSWAAIRIDPDDRERRRTGLLSWSGTTRPTWLLWPIATAAVLTLGWIALKAPVEAPVVSQLDDATRDGVVRTISPLDDVPPVEPAPSATGGATPAPTALDPSASPTGTTEASADAPADTPAAPASSHEAPAQQPAPAPAPVEQPTQATSPQAPAEKPTQATTAPGSQAPTTRPSPVTGRP